MNHRKILFLILFLPLVLIFTASCSSLFSESDTTSSQLVSFYDLRDRESFIQITNTDSAAGRIHVQIFDVGNNCNENNFYDDLTGNDTHVYNLRDIQTNDGNPAGVVLPDGAYGIVVITLVNSTNNGFLPFPDLIGNFRVIDSSGYEYRTNSTALTFFPLEEGDVIQNQLEIYVNFNKASGITFSDVIGVTLDDTGGGEFGTDPITEVLSTNIVDINVLIDVDIFDLDENIFSCRNIIYACTDQENPLLEELLETVGGANVASFEYGINEAIPHSKGGELLCPGNVVDEGFARLRLLEQEADGFGLYIGLNNGNGRGSMDSLWAPNLPNEIAQNAGMDGDGGGMDIMVPGDDT